MPRIARLDTPDLLHHVIIRGIERRNIFDDDKDRDNLIERLSKLLPESKTPCYAWSLLSKITSLNLWMIPKVINSSGKLSFICHCLDKQNKK